MSNTTKYRTYKAYTKYGNEIVYGSYSRKGSKENTDDLEKELKRNHGKYISISDVTDIVRWNG